MGHHGTCLGVGVTSDFGEVQRSPGSLSGRRVLIVEDEVIVAFNMECEVEDAGGVVAGPAYSVGEARLLVDGADVAILDININGEQIWAIADILRARSIPFVFASANCQDPNAIPAKYADVPCFDKPVSMTRLIATLSDLTSAEIAA